MFRPSTAPRWKIAISVLRLPPVIEFSDSPAIARSRNAGADKDTPTLASAMVPDLRKNLRFMFQTLSRSALRSVRSQISDLRSEISNRSLPLKLRRPQDQSHHLRKRIVDTGIDAGPLSLLRARSIHLTHLPLNDSIHPGTRTRNTDHCLLIKLVK